MSNAYTFLQQQREFFSQISKMKLNDLSLSQSPLLKNFSIEERTLLLEQKHLRSLAPTKVSFSDRLLYTPLGLQQMTRESLSKYKANQIEKASKAVDLCSGLGEDSFFIQNPCSGIDFNVQTVQFYQYNLNQLNKEILTICGDITKIQTPKNDIVLIDPVRVKEKNQKHWCEASLSPNWNELYKIVQKQDQVYIKLPRGINLPQKFKQNCTLEYLGKEDECSELSLWFERNTLTHIRATEVISGISLDLDLHSVHFNLPKPLGSYLYEPLKIVVHSHLFGLLAQELNLWNIDSQIVYLSSNDLLQRPLLKGKGYQVISILSFHLKKMEKRGVHLNIDLLRKKKSFNGVEVRTLFITRVNNKHTAILTKALKQKIHS